MRLTEEEYAALSKRATARTLAKPPAQPLNTWTLSVQGVPVPQPRQTQRDKWMKRDCVMRYRAYANVLRAGVDQLQLTWILPEVRNVNLLFVIPIPPSYSKRRRAELTGRPCEVKPDLDNLCKSLLDALWPAGDSMITDIAMRKIWDDGAGARTEIVFRLEVAESA